MGGAGSEFEPVVVGPGFVLVGRTRELRLLSAALSHRPAVVMVEGEAGVGKSRLVEEAARGAAAHGVRTLTGQCHPMREPMPFGPVLEALTPAAHWLPEPERLNPQTGALAPWLPGLAGRLPPAPEKPEDPRAAKFQLLGAVRGVLEALAPVVLVVEDLHWADETTRELLLLLARDPPRGLCLVFTYRREDLPSTTPALGAPYRRPAGTSGAEIHLDPITAQDVNALVSSVLGARATPELVRAVFERSGGLPLVAEEDLLTLAEAGSLLPPGDGTPELEPAVLEGARVPRALRESVLVRVAALPANGAELVRAAAVLAVPTARQVLESVAGLDGSSSGELLEALGAAVLREHPPGRYGLRHALAQQAVYEDILGPHREDLHRRARQVLRSLDPPPLVQIAHHSHALGETRTWLAEAEAAADEAMGLGDDGTAMRLLREILRQPRLDPALRSRCAVALAHAASHATDYAASLATLRRIVLDPELVPAARGEIRLALGLLMLNSVGDHQAGDRELERAVDDLADRPDLAVRAMVALAFNAFEKGDTGLQEAWLDRADRSVRQHPHPRARAALLATRLAILGVSGDPAVWPLVDELPRHAEDPEVMRQTARALYNVADIAMMTGHDDRATLLLEESRQICAQVHFPILELYGRIDLLRLDWLAGRWEGLERRMTALDVPASDLRVLALAEHLVGGSLAAARGQWSRALDAFGNAAVIEERGFKGGHPLSSPVGIARVRLAQGDTQASWETTARALDARRGDARPWADGLLPVSVRAALGCGLTGTAADQTRHVERACEGRDIPALTAELHLARGMLADHDGEHAAAASHFDQALVYYRAIGRPFHAAEAAEYLALSRPPAEAPRAARELSQAADSYTALGAAADAARCQRGLRDLGLARPAPRGRRGYGAELSPRENEVAALLEDGATNQDIAHALSLSVRTVEHHVARTLKKLDTTREALRETSTAPHRGHG